MNHAQLLGGCQDLNSSPQAFRGGTGLFSQLLTGSFHERLLLGESQSPVMAHRAMQNNPSQTVLRRPLLADATFFFKAASWKHASRTTALTCVDCLAQPEYIQSSATMAAFRHPTPRTVFPIPPSLAPGNHQSLLLWTSRWRRNHKTHRLWSSLLSVIFKVHLCQPMYLGLHSFLLNAKYDCPLHGYTTL